ncbi:hypothetical protein ACH5RR_035427 [Cinchona calisaya]|uniref:NAC domain-containing protein n=1 Tax=Cinchona calisaya TaxID=153742 RepID=A0ABD2Y1C7_9GENT
MEKVKCVKNGVVGLPPGFRFHPSDEELVVEYLKRKVLSFPLPASIIPEVEVCKSDPWDLPGELEQERYFFSTREVKYANGKRSNRATGSGYWKATGVDKQVVTSSQRQGQAVVVGMKKTLVFYRGKPHNGIRTDWVMHEYRLVNLQTATDKLAQENWILCRIFLKKRSGKSEDDQMFCTKSQGKKNGGIVFYDFMATRDRHLKLQQDPLPVSSSTCSGSSGITEISSCNIESDDINEESNSSSYSFIPFKRKP